MTTETTLSPAVIEALSIGNLPEIEWNDQDDLCDCLYQRVGWWKNVYLAETLEIRFCCIWEEFYKQFPQHVRKIPGYWNPNTKEWLTEPQEWNGETEMPKAIWYRHLARKFGRPLADIRAEYQDKDELRPKGEKREEPLPFIFVLGGQEVLLDMRKLRLR